MKRYNYILIIFPILLLSACSFQKAGYKVHSVSEKTKNPLKNGISYALPQTVLQIDLLVERNEDIKGPYVDYANILLGIADAIEEDEVTYHLSDIRFSTYSEPDPKAYYYVESRACFPSMVVLPNGIIHSVNINENINLSKDNVSEITIDSKTGKEKMFLEPTGSLNFVERQDTIYTPIVDENNELAYEKSYKTVAKERPVGERAKAAAEQILQIRMKKKELIYGEYEDNYSKNAIDYIYAQLDKMEKDLLSLFAGKTVSTIETKSFYIVPDKSLLVGDEQPFLLCGFSSENGVTTLEKEEGIIIHATIRCEQDLYVLNNFLKRKNNKYNKSGRLVSKKEDKSKGFVYRIPDNALVTVRYSSRTFSEKIIVNQYGTLVKLPEKKLSIKYDTETGNVFSITPLNK